jgi:hypothetical protein
MTLSRDPSDGPEQYCREIEAHLCRKNDGHLIRIVGPAFEQVCAWATSGVPLKVAFRGIDRYFERYYAKGPRRRPVRIEFCEADVLDVFDEWRRAVGIPVRALSPLRESQQAVSVRPADRHSAPAEAGATPSPEHARQHGSLPAHLERIVARLTALRGGEDRALDPVLDAVVREIDSARASAKGLRGAARETFLERLRVLEGELIAAARERCDAATLQRLGVEADAELAPFRERMPREAYEQSRRASVDRLIRERFRLPVLSYD